MSSGVTLASPEGTRLLAVCIAGSGMVFLDATVVNVALPSIAADFGASLSGLQWIINGYLLTLAALILTGGALGDRIGRKRAFRLGIALFCASSVACAVAPSLAVLIASRIAQGVGGALLAPASLALLEANFDRSERGKAIGMWSGLAGAFTAIGPFVGGWLVDQVSWRGVFWLNIPIGVGFLAVLATIPGDNRASSSKSLDVVGSVSAVVALGSLTYALIETPEGGFGVVVIAAIALAVLSAATFVYREATAAEPMLPFAVFHSRTFIVCNVMTLPVYGALGVVFFLVVVTTQQALGYSALEAGAALVPVTLCLMLGSAKAGAFARSRGPRIPMTVGPLFAAVGVMAWTRIEPGRSYIESVLPGAILFGVGLAITVAPLTAAVMGSVNDAYAGVASGVSNAASRSAQLLAVAVVPVAVGLGGDAFRDPVALVDGTRDALVISAVLLVAGAAISFVGLRGNDQVQAWAAPAGDVV